MIPHKKPYVKPALTIILPDTPKYEEIVKKFQAEDEKNKEVADSKKN